MDTTVFQSKQDFEDANFSMKMSENFFNFNIEFLMIKSVRKTKELFF